MHLTEPSASRSVAIDTIRALAVIGVVFNHTIDGLLASGIINGHGPISDLNRALYMFRMPALAFVLGLFMGRATIKRGARGYIQEKVTFGVYIYVVWFFIQMAAEIATSSMKNSPRSVEDLIAIWSMPAHLWFMPFLAVAAIVIGLSQPWRTPIRAVITITALGLVSIITWGWNPAVFGLRGISLLVFTALGATIGSKRLGRFLNQKKTLWFISGLLSLVIFTLLFTPTVVPGTVVSALPYDIFRNIHSLTTALLGVALLVSISVFISAIPILRHVLGFIGARTLEIYLAHVIIVAGTRIVLERIGMESTSGFIVIAMVLGLGLPLLLSYYADGTKLAFLFRVPGALGAWSRSANRQRTSVES